MIVVQNVEPEHGYAGTREPRPDEVVADFQRPRPAVWPTLFPEDNLPPVGENDFWDGVYHCRFCRKCDTYPSKCRLRWVVRTERSFTQADKSLENISVRMLSLFAVSIEIASTDQRRRETCLNTMKRTSSGSVTYAAAMSRTQNRTILSDTSRKLQPVSVVAG